MYESPISLKETCLDVICNNIYTYIGHQTIAENGLTTNKKGCDDERTDKRYKFRDSDIFLVNTMSERLMEKMLEKRILCDATLNIFSSRNTILKTVKIKNCKVTKGGLEILKQHKIIDLEIVNLKNVSLSDILDCLGDWTLQNLVKANFARSTFTDTFRYSFVTKLTSLKSLKSLNLSYTDLNQSTFKTICESLCNLEHVDISGTQVRDLKPLCLLSEKLVTLTICDSIDAIEHMILTLKHLKALKLLDVSLSRVQLDAQELIVMRPIILQLLNRESLIPNLTSLNISGWKEVVHRESLLTFIKNHPKLTFLGIVLNDVTLESAFCDPTDSNYVHNIKIAGLGNEEQIKVTLQCYKEDAKYVHKALNHLFQLTSPFSKARPDILKLVLSLMEAHSERSRVQIAATACFFALTRGGQSKKIHLKLLSEGVNLILHAMESFPDELDLQRISLFTLYNRWILQEAQFDRHRCARLVVHTLGSFEDAGITRMAEAICDILSSKIIEGISNISNSIMTMKYPKSSEVIFRPKRKKGVCGNFTMM
ncbi:protein zyg-11 homolog B-like [Rhynchophorus ferrugineus]|uniref:protein zyg-11 homolog B-like n=1 Tax=Rhynchophorus ferrugineus TaxID=354439 RepID=UPI003FCCE3FB